MNKSTIALMIFAFAGCGSTPAASVDASPTSDAPACTLPATQRYLPLATGNQWTYNITPAGGGTTVMKKNSVEAFEDVGAAKAGIMAYRVRAERSDGVTVDWQRETCEGVIREREQTFTLAGVKATEQYYTPNKLRLDESVAHLTMGATWISTYQEHQIDLVTNVETVVAKSDRWTVVATNVPVTVPAGTFNCLQITKAGVATGTVDKTFYFALGVGKVKEVGKQIEELAAYTVQP